MEAKSSDHLGFANDPTIKKLLGSTDKVLFSGKVFKYNPMLWRQERVVLITTKYLYNLHKKKEKRKIPLGKIDGITKSLANASKEFVIHVTSEYDYRYESDLREKIIQILKQEYLKIYKKNLLIYGVPDEKLVNYVATKDDRKKGQYKIPEDKYRLADENLIIESAKVDVVNDNSLPDLSKGELLYSHKADNKIPLNFFKIVKELKNVENESEYLVEREDSKEIYTLRIIRKIALFNTDLITSKFIEEEAKKNLGNPFLLQPKFVYKGVNAIYVLFNLTLGKNMAQKLKEEKRMNERKVCFFGYQIGLALKHLHEKSAVYNDLRMDNIFIDENNYLYLNDFGIEKLMEANNRKTHTASMIVKYPSRQEYLSPEYFLKREITPAADWWSFGIILYELLIGITPFTCKDQRMYGQELNTQELNFPLPFKHHILLTDNVKGLIRGLLNKDPMKRIGDEVLDNEFFKDKEWTEKEMREKKVDLTYIFLQRSTMDSILNNSVEEPITHLYPAISKEEIRKKFGLS